MAQEYVNAVMSLAWDRWLAPEIARREKLGMIDDEWKLGAAQILFWVNAQPEVRFNGEVAGVFRMKARDSTPSMKPGETVEINERFDAIDEFRLMAEEPVGFATFIRHGGQWHYFGNQCHNLALLNEHLAAASDFLEIARHAISMGKLRPFVDNLFTTYELLAKAVLLQFPQVHEPKTTHGWISTQLNFLGKYCGIDSGFVRTTKRLATLRVPARYLEGSLSIDAQEGELLMSAAESMLVELRYSSEAAAQSVIKNPD